MTTATVLQVLQDLFYVLLHVFTCDRSLTNRKAGDSTSLSAYYWSIDLLIEILRFDWIEQGLTSPPTQCIGYPGDSFTGQKTQPLASSTENERVRTIL